MTPLTRFYHVQVPKETSKLVAGVRVLHDELPAVIDPIIAAINSISNTFLKSIEEESIRSSTTKSSVDVPLDQLSGFRGLAAADGDEEEMAGGTIGTPSTTAAAAASRPEGSTVVHQEISDEFYARTQKLMRVNHNLLNALGVGHLALDGVCTITARGGCVTKLTGAGGGGCALTLLPPHNIEVASKTDLGSVVKDGVNVPAIRGELASLGYDCFETCLGGAGVLLLN
jgi:mevalonate kinase